MNDQDDLLCHVASLELRCRRLKAVAAVAVLAAVAAMLGPLLAEAKQAPPGLLLPPLPKPYVLLGGTWLREDAIGSASVQKNGEGADVFVISTFVPGNSKVNLNDRDGAIRRYFESRTSYPGGR